ncbi:MAG: SIR2 family protein [Gammaproteobacteria bacterium]|nr:SIR2 family protein [Gammaproteobacteria bacterium]
MDQQIAWLHLSDLHIRAGDQYDQQVALSPLLGDLTAIVEQGRQDFDCIFVTGDVAYSGRAEEYEVATKFFRSLSSATAVPTGRIYCVPGNHDVDRSRLTPFLVESARTLGSCELVLQVIGNASERSLFTDRQRPYYDFLKATFPWAGTVEPSDLSYTHILELKGRRLAIVGLNSAWVAGSDDDHGRIVVGERQAREALEKTAQADFVVGLLHHPFSWLSEFDASDVTALLNTRCDFLLHGHVHELGVVSLVSPDSESFHLAAGATYQGRRELLSYNFVSLDPEAGRARVTMRRYSDRDGGFWAPATEMYRSAPEGVVSLTLPERLSRQVQPPDLNALNERLSELVSETTSSSDPSEPLPSVPRVPPILVKEIEARRCVLFAGAGTSMDAKLPGWLELLRGMIERSNDSGTLNDSEHNELEALLDAGEHMVVAAFCRAKLGVYEFAEHLRSQLSDSTRASRTHRILSEIPFRAAITTNFDSFLEHSRERAQVILPDMMEKMGAAGVESLLGDAASFPVIKMHGTAIDVDSIVLTRSDFRKILFERPKYREFLRRLFIDSTVFFYGYSFRDPNVDFLLQDLMASYSGNARPHYALLPNPGAIAMRYWFEDFNIRVILYDLWNGSHVVSTAFLQELSKQVGR